MTSELMRVETDSGGAIFFEVDDEAAGFEHIAHGKIIEARRKFESGLQDVSDAAHRALSVFRDGTLKPDNIEIEFGVSFNAEAGAVFAKTSAQGHLTVKLAWSGDGAQATITAQ